MEIDKTSCWYDTKECPKQMVLGSQGKLFSKLEHSDHFPILNELINFVIYDKCLFPKMIDIGCGAGDVGRLFGDAIFYAGFDLPHIIQSVARVANPVGKYFEGDVFSSDLSFIQEFDIVLANAFIDVLDHPIEALEKLLPLCQDFLIIHRQSFSSTLPTQLIKHPSYGGFSYQSIIAEDEFNFLIEKNKMEIIRRETIYKNHPFVECDHQSVLLRKK